jgi:hypothetical protein
MSCRSFAPGLRRVSHNISPHKIGGAEAQRILPGVSSSASLFSPVGAVRQQREQQRGRSMHYAIQFASLHELAGNPTKPVTADHRTDPPKHPRANEGG